MVGLGNKYATAKIGIKPISAEYANWDTAVFALSLSLSFSGTHITSSES